MSSNMTQNTDILVVLCSKVMMRMRERPKHHQDFTKKFVFYYHHDDANKQNNRNKTKIIYKPQFCPNKPGILNINQKKEELGCLKADGYLNMNEIPYI